MVPAARVRVLTHQLKAALAGTERSTHEFWKHLPRGLGGGYIRIVNNTYKCKGPALVCFMQEPPELPFGEMPRQWLSDDQMFVPLRLAYGTLCPISSAAVPTLRVIGTTESAPLGCAVPFAVRAPDHTAVVSSACVLQWTPQPLPMAFAQPLQPPLPLPLAQLVTSTAHAITTPAATLATATSAVAEPVVHPSRARSLGGGDASGGQWPIEVSGAATAAVAAAAEPVANAGQPPTNVDHMAPELNPPSRTNDSSKWLTPMGIHNELRPATLESMLESMLDDIDQHREPEIWELLHSLPPSPPSPYSNRMHPCTRRPRGHQLVIIRLRRLWGGLLHRILLPRPRAPSSNATPLEGSKYAPRLVGVYMSMMVLLLGVGSHYLYLHLQVHSANATTSFDWPPEFVVVQPLMTTESMQAAGDSEQIRQWDGLDLLERAKRQSLYCLAVVLYSVAELYDARVRVRVVGRRGTRAGAVGAEAGAAMVNGVVGGAVEGGSTAVGSANSNQMDMRHGTRLPSARMHTAWVLSAGALRTCSAWALLACRVVLTVLPGAAWCERFRLTLMLPTAKVRQALYGYRDLPTVASYACHSWLLGWMMMRTGVRLSPRFSWCFVVLTACLNMITSLAAFARSGDAVSTALVITLGNGAALLGGRHCLSFWLGFG